MKEMRGVATNTYLRKNIRKTKKDEGLQILKIRVRELFIHGEGISTSHTHHKGQRPQIKCARVLPNLFYPFRSTCDNLVRDRLIYLHDKKREIPTIHKEQTYNKQFLHCSSRISS